MRLKRKCSSVLHYICVVILGYSLIQILFHCIDYFNNLKTESTQKESIVEILKKIHDKIFNSDLKYDLNQKKSYLINALKNYESFSPSSDLFQFNSGLGSYPNLGVVIVTTGEHPGRLYDAVGSLLLNTSWGLLADIVIINVCTFNAKYVKLLDELPKVITLNIKNNTAINKARYAGSLISLGEALFYAEPNCYFYEGWELPLLEVLRNNPRSVAVPTIQRLPISYYNHAINIKKRKGGFNWKMQFVWVDFSELDKMNQKSGDDTLRSPRIPGNLYMISRYWWNLSGKFDIDLHLLPLQILDLSLRSWMCGGEILIIPSRKIGYQETSRSDMLLKLLEKANHEGEIHDKDNTNYTFLRDAKRVVDVWFGEYSQSFYDLYPSAADITIRKMSSRKALKKSLECNSFDWFLTKVYPELAVIQPLIVASGMLYNNQLCISTPQLLRRKRKDEKLYDKAVLSHCVSDSTENWLLTEDGWIKQGKFCLGSLLLHDSRLYVFICDPGPQQRWIRREKRIIHGASDLCLDSLSSEGVLLLPCVEGALSQEWDFTDEIDSKYFKRIIY